jgi:hypothetical protein
MTPDRDEITRRLMEPFPQEALKRRDKPGGRGFVTYVDGTTVFRRLIHATGNNFNVEVTDQQIIPYGSGKTDERLLLKATVRITIPDYGHREHTGVQLVNATSGGEDLWKGAITDAIKKAATLFGVGLELYGPDYEAGEIAAPQQPCSQAVHRPVQQPKPATQGNTHNGQQHAPQGQQTTQRRRAEPQLDMQQVLGRAHGIAAKSGMDHDDLKMLIIDEAAEHGLIISSSKDAPPLLVATMANRMNVDPRSYLQRLQELKEWHAENATTQSGLHIPIDEAQEAEYRRKATYTQR